MTVSIPAADGVAPAELGVPAGRGPWPGVLVVHDALGMTSDLRRQVDWLTEAGYLTLAPDLYRRGGRIRCLVSTMRDLAAGSGPAFDDLDAARGWLAAHPDCTGGVAVVGFCMGGGFALALATTGHYAAAAANYGALTGPAAEHLHEACPIIASFGGRDRSLRREPDRLGTALSRAGVEHTISIYRDAGHGFMNDHDPGEVPVWARAAGSLVAMGFHGPSATEARRRILAFLDVHLRDGTPDKAPVEVAAPATSLPSRRHRMAARVEHVLDARTAGLAAWLVRVTRGRIGRLWRRRVLVLTTTGRRTGRTRRVPLQYFPDGGGVVVVATNSGLPRPPGWYFNLMATGRGVVEIGGRITEVRAAELSASEEDAFWPQLLETAPDYVRYRRRTRRRIPLVRLTAAPR